MAQMISNRHQRLIINGETVTGLSKDKPPVELPLINLIEEDFASDGTLLAYGTSMRGGPVKVKLQPTSPQVKSWMRYHAQIQNGAIINFSGVYGDPRLGYDTLLRGGFMKEARPGVSPEQDAEFTFIFEETVPQFENAKFTPSFAEVQAVGTEASTFPEFEVGGVAF